LLCGRRWGKNYISDRTAIKRIYQDLANGKGNKNANAQKRIPRLLYWFVAPDYSMTKIMRNEIFNFFAEANAMDLIQIDLTLSKNQLWLYPDILIEFKSADNPQKLVGVGVDGLRCTEVARMKSEVWNDNLRPCLADKQGWAIFDTTPLGRNWFVRDLYEPALTSPDWQVVTGHTVENTMVAGLAKEVELARKTMPDKYFRRNYEASLDAFFGQVYEDFKPSEHIKDFDFNREDYKTIRVGVDWGYAHNGAMIVVGYKLDGSIDIIDEVAEPRLLVYHDNADCWVNRAKNIMSDYGAVSFFCGVDQPESIDLLRLNNIDALPCENDVKQGIFTVASLFHIPEDGKPIIRINSRCKKLINGLLSYKYKELKDGVDSEEVEKMNDDEVDALRYCIYSNRHLLEYLTKL